MTDTEYSTRVTVRIPDEWEEWAEELVEEGVYMTKAEVFRHHFVIGRRVMDRLPAVDVVEDDPAWRRHRDWKR